MFEKSDSHHQRRKQKKGNVLVIPKSLVPYDGVSLEAVRCCPYTP